MCSGVEERIVYDSFAEHSKRSSLLPGFIGYWFSLEAKHLISVLVFLGRHNKIPETACLKQQKLILSQFWRLQVQDQSCHIVRLGWELSSWLVDGHLRTVGSHGLFLVHGCGERDLSLSLFISPPTLSDWGPILMALLNLKYLLRAVTHVGC